MNDEWKFIKGNDILIPNMAHWSATSEAKEPYLVQVSWPLGWPTLEQMNENSEPANVM